MRHGHHLTTPQTAPTVLYAFINSRPPSKIEAVRMLKYLVEVRGADIYLKDAGGMTPWDLAYETNDITYLKYFISVRNGAPSSVADLASSDEWESPEEEEAAIVMALAEEEADMAREAAAKALFDEQEAKANEAAAALLADLDAEDQREAVAAAGKKKTKKSNKKKKEAGGGVRGIGKVCGRPSAGSGGEQGGRHEACTAAAIAGGGAAAGAIGGGGRHVTTAAAAAAAAATAGGTKRSGGGHGRPEFEGRRGASQCHGHTRGRRGGWS